MKQLLQIVILLLLGSITVSAQNKNSLAQKQLKLKEKEKQEQQELKTRAPKPVIYSNTKEYRSLKKSNNLSNYNVKSATSSRVLSPSIVTTTDNPTPCEFPSISGISLFPDPSSGEVNDDVTGSIALPFSFCFYGVSYNTLNIFDNGNVQFATNSTAFTSTGFPSNSVNMIAPFWADGTADVNVGGLHYGKVLVDIPNATRVVITWDSLPYYQGGFNSDFTDLSLLNSFQLVLTDGTDPMLPFGKNVGFYYRNMQWTTGDASDGANGFPDPTITPENPATVGANQGNGTDFIQLGRFGVPGSIFDGPNGSNDGVSWLNGKKFFFDLCPPAGDNFEPISTLIDYCDTVKVCGNDTIILQDTYLGPEAVETVSITAAASTLGSSFSYSTQVNPNGGTDINIIIDGNTATGGYHTITITATDNGTSPLSNVKQLVVFVDQGSVNNLNGSIVVTPTLGACPGGTVNANVIVTGGTPDSYLWNNGAVTASTSFTTVIPEDSLIYVSITSGQCSKTILGHININPVPVAAITGNMSYCNGDNSSTMLTAVNTSTYGTQAPYTYAWSAASGSLSPTNTQTANATGGIYTVTVTNQYGCKSSTSATVTMNESPNYSISSANAISSGSVYCVNQDTARLVLNFSSSANPSCGLALTDCVSSSTVQVGTGTTTGSGSSYTPYNGFWESGHHQYLFRASELISAGVQPGKLSSVAFNLTNINGGNTSYANFAIKLKCTSTNILTTADGMESGLTQVFSTPNLNVTTGWNTHNFNQDYVWDGTSNLLVDVCYYDVNWNDNNTVQYTNVGYNAVRYNSSSSDQCGLSTTDGVSTNRPNMRFGNCLAQQSGSQFNVVVTPTTGVVIPAANDSINIALPGTVGTTCYTVSLINQIGGCSKDTVICLTSTIGTIAQATLTANSASVCPGYPVTLSALGSLTSYTISYDEGAGIQTVVNNSVSIVPTGTTNPVFGIHTYTLYATGPCNGPLDTFYVDVNVTQGVTQGTLNANVPSTCPNGTVTLSAQGSLASYTISYRDQFGALQTSVNSSITVTTPSVAGTYIYTLSATGPCSGPLSSYTTSIDVIVGTTDATLTATPNIVCIGDQITLSASSSSATSLSTYTIQYNNGAGIQTSPNAAVFFTTAVNGPSTYSLIAQGSCGAPIMTFVTTATVNAVTNLSITPMPNITKCFAGTATLNAIVTPTMSNLGYLWTTGGLPAPGTNTLATYTASSTGVYSVVATASCAIPATATVSVNQFTNNLSVSIIDSTAVCPKTGFVLNALVSGGRPAYNFNWFISPNATNISNSNPLSANAPDVQGVYSVTVTVTDSCGFNNSDIQLITVLPPCDITIPNIITANGDGINDIFKITNIEYHSNSVLTVFDRWGRKVYENSNYNNDWKGDNLNDGTYFYILDVPDDKKYNGYITIFSGK